MTTNRLAGFDDDGEKQKGKMALSTIMIEIF
jgi:hypothetical protein